MTDKFIELIIQKINTIITCYYEEAPSNATFPYSVMTTLNLTSLDSGYLGVFDLEIYINELSEQSVESIMDSLREELMSFSFFSNELSYHVGFDNQTIVKSNEQDLAIRRITFSARIFK